MDMIPQDSIPHKQCTGPCGRLLPATPEFFYRQKHGKYGLRGQCKVCKDEKTKIHNALPEVQERLRERLQTYHRPYRQRPEVQKRISEYQKAYRQDPEKREQKREYLRAYRERPETQERYREWQQAYRARPEVQDRQNERQRSYYRDRPEIRAQKKDYQSRPENKERIRAYHKAYYNRPDIREREIAWRKRYYNDPEVRPRYLAYHKENSKRPERKAKASAYRNRPEIRERKIAYLKGYQSRPENKERAHAYSQLHGRAYASTRRARIRAISGTHTTAQILDLLKRQRYHCYYCREKLKRIKGKYIYHVDHTFPISRVVGTDIPANDISYLVVTCPHCNDSKNDKFPWEWPEGGRLL